MQCPGCQTQNDEAGRFCSQCGTALSMVCPACQSLSRPGVKFCGGCGGALAASAAAAGKAANAATAAPARDQAERRQLTVLFCDLVGSTALAQRLDAEDLRALTGDYRQACAGAIARFDGFMAQFLGDGVLAYFGFPAAHEDNAERAVRAALAIVQAVGQLESQGQALQVRIGIATGPVVVGDIVGAGPSSEQSAVGETPNLAARLQALAEPGGVVIDPGTRNLLGGALQHIDLGLQQLKGLAEPVRAWRVVGEAPTESRFQARQAALTRFVGREEELGLLLGRWQQARAGEGQVLVLSGEPGIGKSRIVETLIERIANAPRALLRYQCSPHHTHSALYPVINHLKHAAGFKANDGSEAQLDKLEAMAALSSDEVATIAPLLASLLSIPFGERYPPMSLAPEQQKEKTLQALIDLVVGLARQQPVLFLFEDAHWVDPTTLELLERSIERVQDTAVLMVITARPEFTPPWSGHAHVSALQFNRLGRGQCAALVGQVADGKTLPDDVLHEIVAKTDGVPLFIEELTKTVLESGLLTEEGGAWRLARPLSELAIPSSLQDSLMARLDRLGPVKALAQIGACIGREFSHALLAAVAPLNEAELRSALDQLVRAQLVFRRRAAPDASYLFKHALVQDVAYSSLLRSKRQALHAAIAQALEDQFPQIVQTQPEISARHCTDAGLLPQAIGYWLKAGQLATGRSANREAVAHLDKGLALLATLPESPERDRRELDLRIALGGSLMAVEGYASTRSQHNYQRGLALCEALGDGRRVFPLLSAQWLFHASSGQITQAGELAETLMPLAERERERTPGVLMVAHGRRAFCALAAGETLTALDEFRQTTALYEPERDRGLALVNGHDSGLVLQAHFSLALWSRGHAGQAQAMAGQAIAAAAAFGHVNTLAFVLNHGGGLLSMMSRHVPAVQAHAARLLEIGRQYRLPMWERAAARYEGWAQAAQGRLVSGAARMQASLRRAQAMNLHIWSPLWLCELAAVQGRLGDFDAGLRLIEEAYSAMQGGERFVEANVHRVQGELLLGKAKPFEARACYERALGVARAQGAKMFELRAATSLARLWQSQGQATEARALLAPVYAGFNEGFDLPDLLDAKALLDAPG